MIWEYTWQVVRHKYFTAVEAYKLGVPLLGLIHDLSKLTPGEFFAYARYFYPGGSPNDSKHGADFDVAWNHHQKHNKHHWQYWVLINDSSKPQIRALPMPERYILEMVADWRGAGRAYGKNDTIVWYLNHHDDQIMHPDTRARVEHLLGITNRRKEGV